MPQAFIAGWSFSSRANVPHEKNIVHATNDTSIVLSGCDINYAVYVILFWHPAVCLRNVFALHRRPLLFVSWVIRAGIGIGGTEVATGLGEETTTGTGGATGAGAERGERGLVIFWGCRHPRTI